MTIEHVILVPLFVTLVGILFLGWFYRKRSYRRPLVSKANIFRCTECGKVYLDPRFVPVAKCPKCSALNEAIKR